MSRIEAELVGQIWCENGDFVPVGGQHDFMDDHLPFRFCPQLSHMDGSNAHVIEELRALAVSSDMIVANTSTKMEEVVFYFTFGNL